MNIYVLVLLIIECVSMLLGIFVLISDLSFLMTKKEAIASVITITKTNEYKPYQITLKYFDEYKNDNVTKTLKDFDLSFGKELESKQSNDLNLEVYYQKYFHATYLKSNKHPNYGYIFVLLLFITICFFSISPTIRKIYNPNATDGW